MYRIKTREEFTAQYGQYWQGSVGWSSPSMDFAFGRPVSNCGGDNLYDHQSCSWYFNSNCITSDPLPYGYQAAPYVHVNVDTYAITNGMSAALDTVSNAMRSNGAVLSEILDRLTPKQSQEPVIQNPAKKTVKHDDLYKKPTMTLKDKDW